MDSNNINRAEKLEKIQILARKFEILTTLCKAEELNQLSDPAINELYDLFIKKLKKHNENMTNENLYNDMPSFKDWLTKIYEQDNSSFLDKEEESNIEELEDELEQQSEEAEDSNDIDWYNKPDEDDDSSSDDEPSALAKTDTGFEDSIDDEEDSVQSFSNSETPLEILSNILKGNLVGNTLKFNYKGIDLEMDETLDGGFIVIHPESSEELKFEAGDTNAVKDILDDFISELDIQTGYAPELEESEETNEKAPAKPLDHDDSNNDAELVDDDLTRMQTVVSKLKSIVANSDLIKINAPEKYGELTLVVDDVNDISNDGFLIATPAGGGEEIQLNFEDIESVELTDGKILSYEDLLEESNSTYNKVKGFEDFLNS